MASVEELLESGEQILYSWEVTGRIFRDKKFYALTTQHWIQKGGIPDAVYSYVVTILNLRHGVILIKREDIKLLVTIEVNRKETFAGFLLNKYDEAWKDMDVTPILGVTLPKEEFARFFEILKEQFPIEKSQQDEECPIETWHFLSE